MEYKIRKIKTNEYEILKDFLYEAIFVPEGAEIPSRSIVKLPALKIYIENFGEKNDNALVAEVNGKIVGAIWARIINDYGHIDDETPSLTISLYKEYRGLGIGTEMIKKMLILLKESGYKRVSLSVQKENYAAKLYRKLGFNVVIENEEDYVMAFTFEW